jgi:DNA polymerase III delta subunit
MDYLFCGQDSNSKNDQIEKIKRSFFSSALDNFNFEVFYSDEIRDKKTLEEAFLRLPVKSKARIVLIREIDKLSNSLKEFVSAYLKKPQKNIVLILETSKDFNLKDEFLAGIKGFIKLFESKKDKVFNSFDLYRAVEARRPDRALEVLSKIQETNKPPIILGGIAGYFKKRFSREDKKLRLLLQALLEADIQLKSSSVKQELVLEKLIVRICLID